MNENGFVSLYCTFHTYVEQYKSIEKNFGVAKFIIIIFSILPKMILGTFENSSIPPRGYYSKGGYYSSFLWRFTSPLSKESFEDFAVEQFDFFYTVSVFIFVTFGLFGLFLNGRRVFIFCCSNTVRQKYISSKVALNTLTIKSLFDIYL